MTWTPFLTLLVRETYRFTRLFVQTIAPPIITTVMFILIFGYSLGTRIREIEGHPYIIYILPGLIQMGVIMNAYANSSTSLFVARMERSIENLIVAPLHYIQIVSAYMMGGIIRGLVVGGTILACSMIFVDIPFSHGVTIFLALFFTSFLFSGLGIISALYAEHWDKISIFTNFVITPLVYLGGVFYSIHMLPPIFKTISQFNPIYYCIDLARYGFLGQSDSPIWISLSVVASTALIVYLICIYLFWKGYKIVQ